MELNPPVNATPALPPLPDMTALNASLLHQIVEQAPRLLKEGLYLAAIPYSYNVALLTALRQRDDDKDARLVERLAEYSFITPLRGAPSGMSYAVQVAERELLQKQWLTEDAAAYRAAHERAHHFWRDTPPTVSDPFISIQNILYHELIATPEAGIETLIIAFRDYSTLRRLAAIDRLLITVEEANQRLIELNDPVHPRLADTLGYLRARLDQLRGNWQRAKTALDPLIQKPLSARLHPYVLRAYGLSLVQTGQYVEAMEHLERALKEMQQRGERAEELGFTMLALGDANVRLALAARGYFADPQPPETVVEAVRRYLPLLPFPLMIYLSTRGLNFWHPDSWPAMKSQDWIIARLFGRGAKWYRAADKLLEEDSRRTVWGEADEKLAWLYLAMGDARQAVPRFQELLAGDGIEEFQRASAHLGMAESYWQLGRVEEAERLALEALPLVERYEATDLCALGEDLLGKIMARKGDCAMAITRFGRALTFYQRNGDLVNATAMAEELERLATYPEASVRASAQNALDTAKVVLPIRHYPARFQHTLLQYFQWGMVAILALMVFLTPMLAVRVQQGSFLQYSIGFETQPPLQAGTGIIPLDAEPSFDAGIIPNAVPDTALNVVFWLVLILVVIYTLVGIYLIVRTRFSSLQEAAQAQTLAISDEGIALGNDATIPWNHISHVLRAETTFNNSSIPIATTLVLSTGQQQISVQGATAFYETLRTRILQRVAPTARLQTVNSTVFPSPLAWLYLISFGIIWALAVASTDDRLGALLSLDLPPLDYSILDLYPFLYVGLVIPPLYWMVIHPLRALATLRAHRQTAIVLAAVLLVMVVVHGLPWLRPWFLQPDIYIPITAVILGVALVVATVRARYFALPGTAPISVIPRFIPEPSPSPQKTLLVNSLDSAILLFAVGCILVGGWAGIQTLVSYDLVQRGDAALLEYDARTHCGATNLLNLGGGEDAPSTDRVACPEDPRLLDAVANYEAALVWQADNTLAVRGLGAAHIQQEQFDQAIADFTSLIALDPMNGYYYADRAVTNAAWSRFALLRDNQPNAIKYHDLAILDFANAIQAEPYTSDFYLWRGSAYHAINLFDNARADYTTAHQLRRDDPRPLTNLGWLAFQQGQLFKSDAEQNSDPRDKADLLEAAFTEFQNARAFFQQAIENSVIPSADLYLALGYAHYELGEALQQGFSQTRDEDAGRAAGVETMYEHYQAALDNWEEGVRLAPDSATAYNLRATGYWRIGTLYPNGRRGDICSDADAPTALKLEKEQWLLQAVEDFARAGELNPADDFNFRTQGQVHFLLRNCPNQEVETQLKRSIESYTRALSTNPEAVPYLQFRPRITYTLFLNVFQDQPERAVEFHPYALTACNDYQRLLLVAPDNPGNDAVAQRVLPMTQAQADAEIAARRYDLAYNTYRCLIEIAPTPTNHFNGGLTALSLGDGAQAQTWYDEGMRLAESNQDIAALDGAIAAIGALSQSQPDLPDNTAAIFDALVTVRRGLN